MEHVAEYGQEEGSRLARAGLSAGHEVPLLEDDGDGVLLDRSGALVAGQLEWELGLEWDFGQT